MGKVSMYRYYRDIAMIKCPYIGIGTFILTDKFARKPIVITSMRIGTVVKALFPASTCLAAYFYSFDFFSLELGYVHIEHHSV